ncbi:hypothetical protein QBC34DRAFT_489588 [Podospora aff. communis PSN243]|uniref:DUF7703 domain-containing protein n=1 Tax=Podospora aff. communis PSN243 TaxID=3040156 RepID=A0AAV9H857_9PEZI|nr:hypothetical protein QBC34DRAFT_489588 [Podospora aff. communis PSN243]
MAVNDNGMSKNSPPKGQKLTIVIVLNSLALWNVLELIFIIWATFKRRRGLYFWSFVVATLGVATQAIALTLKYVQATSPWVYATLMVSGWVCMVTGQSLVLYSRLHLIMLSSFRLKLVKRMIIVNAFVCHVPVIAMVYGVHSSNPEPFLEPYSVYEKLQVTLFFIQEITISGLYIYETTKLMRIRKGLHDTESGTNSSRHLMTHLILVNIVIVILDIAILALEYSGMFDLQTSCKSFVYSVKLKLEFSILNRLVELTTRSASHESSEFTSAPSRGDRSGNMPMDVIFDGVRRGKAADLGNDVYVRSETASGDEVNVKAGEQAVVMTTEVSVRRNTMAVGRDVDEESGGSGSAGSRAAA